MKRFIFLSGLFICLFALSASAQKTTTFKNQPKVFLNSNKVSVTQYDSLPPKDVAGKGVHNHPTRLTILLNDATVTVITNGKSKIIKAKAGDSLWSGGGTHTVINTGNAAVKTVIIEPKK
jgi:hypothetical protein